MEDEDKIRFSEIRSDITSFGRPYNYRIMELPWDDDFVNVMEPYNDEIFVMGTEKGYVILHNISKNRVVSVFKVEDKWISSIAYQYNSLWCTDVNHMSVCAYNIKSHKKTAQFKEPASREKYSDKGIQLQKTKNKQHHIFNCGDLSFKIISIRTKKILKAFDVARELRENEFFSSLKPAERVIRSFVVSQETSRVYILINRYHPCLIIYDFYKMKLVRFVFLVEDKIDRTKFTSLNMRIFKSDTDDFLTVVYQVRENKSNRIYTHAVVYTYSPIDDVYSHISSHTLSSTIRLPKTASVASVQGSWWI